MSARGSSLSQRLRSLYRALIPLRLRRALWDLRHPPTQHSEITTSAPADSDVPQDSANAPSDSSESGVSPEPATLVQPRMLCLAPSYSYKWGESLRLLEALTAAHSGGEPYEHPVNRRAYKLRGYELAEELGVRHPTVFGVYDGANDVDWDALPKRFVAKSRWGCSSRRVKLLERVGEDFLDIRGDGVLTRAALCEWLDSTDGLGDPLIDRASFASERPGFWFEELLAPLPHDWKVYCFHGEVGLITAIDRERECYAVYDPQFQLITGVLGSHIYAEGTIAPPLHPALVLDAARALSAALKHPHAAIDLYDTDDGVVFGEVTAIPGVGYSMLEPYDTLLGQLWEDAEVRLLAEGHVPWPECRP